MTKEKPADEDRTLAHHLGKLAMTLDDVVDLLTRPHKEGEIHPEALAKAEVVSRSLNDVIHALTHHEHLAMTSDDVWHALTIKHVESDDGTIT